MGTCVEAWGFSVGEDFRVDIMNECVCVCVWGDSDCFDEIIGISLQSFAYLRTFFSIFV